MQVRPALLLNQLECQTLLMYYSQSQLLPPFTRASFKIMILDLLQNFKNIPRVSFKNRQFNPADWPAVAKIKMLFFVYHKDIKFELLKYDIKKNKNLHSRSPFCSLICCIVLEHLFSELFESRPHRQDVKKFGFYKTPFNPLYTLNTIHNTHNLLQKRLFNSIRNVNNKCEEIHLEVFLVQKLVCKK